MVDVQEKCLVAVSFNGFIGRQMCVSL